MLLFFNSTLFCSEKKKNKIGIKSLIFEYKKSLAGGGIFFCLIVLLYKNLTSSEKSSKKDKKKKDINTTKKTIKHNENNIKTGGGQQSQPGDVFPRPVSKKDLEKKEIIVAIQKLQALIKKAYENQEYTTLRTLLGKPEAIDLLDKHTYEEKREIFEVLYLNSVQDGFNEEDMQALLNLIKAGVKITEAEFKKLYENQQFLEDRLSGKIKNEKYKSFFSDDHLILLWNYAFHYGPQILYDLLLNLEVIEHNEAKTKVEQLLEIANVDNKKNGLLYEFLVQEQEKIEKENGDFLFKTIDAGRVNDFIVYVKELKSKNKNPLDFIEENTERTVLHYLMGLENSCWNDYADANLLKNFDQCYKDIIDCIFNYDTNEKIIWHKNIAHLDKDKKIFLDYAKTLPSVSNLIYILSSFDEGDIKNLLETKDTEKQNTAEYLLEYFFGSSENGKKNIEILYFLLSYGISLDNFDKYFNSCIFDHLVCFNIYYQKIAPEAQNIIINHLKKALSRVIKSRIKHLNDLQDTIKKFTGAILAYSNKDVAKEFLEIFFKPSEEIDSDKIKEYIKNILSDYGANRTKNCSLLLDIFNQYYCSENDYQEFKKQLFELAWKKQNGEIIQEILFDDFSKNTELTIQNQSLIERKDAIHRTLAKHGAEWEFMSQFYIDLLACVFKKYSQESQECQDTITQIKELINFAYDQKRPFLFPQLLLFCKKQDILRKVYPDFDISRLFEHGSIDWNKAIFTLLEHEFILYIQNKNSLFSFKSEKEQENIKKYLEEYYQKRNEYLKSSCKNTKNLLHHAVIENNRKAINLLRDHTKNRRGEKIIYALLLQKDEQCNTPLHYTKEPEVLLRLGYTGYQKNKNILNIKNCHGKRIFESFFEKLSKEEVSKIFKNDIFDHFASDAEYCGALWLGLFKESRSNNGKFRSEISNYCLEYIDCIDDIGVMYILRSCTDVESENLLRKITEKNKLLSTEKIKVIQWCLNNKDEKYLKTILKFSQFFIEDCINDSDEFEKIHSYFDLILESLNTGFHTKFLFEEFKKNIKEEWEKSEYKVRDFVKALIDKNAHEIIESIFQEKQEENEKNDFKLSDNDIKELNNYALDKNQFNIAQLFSDKKNMFDIECVEKSMVKTNKNGNAEKYILKNKEKMEVKTWQEYKNKVTGDTLLHMYKLPIDFVYRDQSLLYELLENYNLNLFTKNKNQVPAIMHLCSHMQYRRFVDWWVGEKLKDNQRKGNFVKKIMDDVAALKEPVSKYDDSIRKVRSVDVNEILFYFSTICRLKKSVKKLNVHELGIDENNLENSDNKLGALFYYVNFIVDPQKTSNEHNKKLLSFYKSIPEIISFRSETDKEGYINITALKDPVLNITPSENSKFMRDQESRYLSHTLRGDTYWYENQVEEYKK